MRSNLVDLEARLLHSTVMAYKLDFGTGTTVWLPKSQCQVDRTPGITSKHGLVVVTLEQALAEEKGIV